MLSAAEIYSLLETHPVKVVTDEGIEFFCIPRCLGFHQGMQTVATLSGIHGGEVVEVVLSRDWLEVGGEPIGPSGVVVHDRDGVHVRIDFFEPVLQIFSNHFENRRDFH